MDATNATDTAIFAAGCFWGVEAAFRAVPGVVDAECGYCGGHVEAPTYEQVCTGTTGHAEAVRVTYDASRVGYDDLLAAFWASHDPTTADRQGPDVGTQYRSAIFTLDAGQQAAAERSREELDASGRLAREVVTQVEPAGTFWRAEEHHQRYHERHGSAGCRIV